MFLQSTYTKYIVSAYRADGSEVITVEKISLFGADEFALSLAKSMASDVGARVTITANVVNEDVAISIILEELTITE